MYHAVNAGRPRRFAMTFSLSACIDCTERAAVRYQTRESGLKTSAKALCDELLADSYLNDRGTIPELGLEENVGSTEESFFQTDDDLKSGVACV